MELVQQMADDLDEWKTLARVVGLVAQDDCAGAAVAGCWKPACWSPWDALRETKRPTK